MLQSIRDRTHGWIAGIIISILILSFALWGISSYFLGGSANNIVAKVNGVNITKSQLASAYERLRRQLQMQYSSSYEIPERAESAIKNRALQTLINIQVLKQGSQSQGYRISSRQIDNFLESMPEFQVNGQFSYERLQQMLATTLINSNDFLDLIKTTLLIDQPRLGIIFTSYPLSKEVTDMIALINQERDIQYTVLPLQPKQNITIPDAKIQAYYTQHQDDFKTPEQVSVDYIQLSLNDLMKEPHPTDVVIKSFYNENINSFALPAQWKLDSLIIPLKNNASDQEVKQAAEEMDQIVAKAKQGVSFVDLAKEYSLKEANDNFRKGVMLNQVSTELQKILLTLTKPQQLATPVRTSQGIILLKAIDVKEPQVQTFEQVKDKVKETLNRQQAEEKFASLKEKLANIAYEHPDSLQPVATSLNLPIKTTSLFTKDKGNKIIYKFFFKRTFQDLLFYKDLRVFNLIAKDFFTSLIKKSKKVNQISKVVFNLLYADFSDFQKIKVPTLIIANKQDEIFTPEQIKKLKAKIPQAKLLELTGNHTWCLYESKKFNTMVIDFVNKKGEIL